MAQKKVTTEHLAQMVGRGFQDMEGRFTKVEDRLDGIDGRLDGIDGRLDAIEVELVGIRKKLDNIIYRHEYEDLRERVALLEKKFTHLTKK